MKLTTKSEIAFNRQCKRSEKNIEEKVCDHAKSKGFLTPKLSTPGQRYWPDRPIFCPHGYMFFMEFKAPSGRLSGGQERRIEKLRELGYTVYIVDNVDTGKMWIDQEKAKLDLIYKLAKPEV